jgi:hypothetical protein
MATKKKKDKGAAPPIDPEDQPTEVVPRPKVDPKKPEPMPSAPIPKKSSPR